MRFIASRQSLHPCAQEPPRRRAGLIAKAYVLVHACVNNLCLHPKAKAVGDFGVHCFACGDYIKRQTMRVTILSLPYPFRWNKITQCWEWERPAEKPLAGPHYGALYNSSGQFSLFVNVCIAQVEIAASKCGNGCLRRVRFFVRSGFHGARCVCWTGRWPGRWRNKANGRFALRQDPVLVSFYSRDCFGGCFTRSPGDCGNRNRCGGCCVRARTVVAAGGDLPFCVRSFFSALLFGEVVRDVLAFVGGYDCLHKLNSRSGSLPPPPTSGRLR